VFRTGNLASPVFVIKTDPHVVLDARVSSAGPFLHAFVKLQPTNVRSIEAVCSWLALEMRLPVPEPYFVHVSRTKIRSKCRWDFESAEAVVCFGSAAVEGAQTLRLARAGAEPPSLLAWAQLARAAVFDHLIANDDRSADNVLIDTGGKLWLIDHARALGGGGQPLFSNLAFPVFQSFLLNLIAALPAAKRIAMRRDLLAACADAAAAVLRLPYTGLLVPEEIGVQMASYLSQRASRLGPSVLHAVGIPELGSDDVSGVTQ
jgi:hypothetical protein